MNTEIEEIEELKMLELNLSSLVSLFYWGNKFEEVYDKGLEVMDMTAFTLCKENSLPIIVFDMNKKGNLKNLVEGQKIGTLVEM